MNNDTKRLIRKAAEIGFEPDGKNGKGHLIFVHTGSGKKYTCAATPSDWRSVRNALASMERISGQKTERVSHGRSRKKTQGPTFIETHVPPSQYLARQRNQARAKERDLKIEALLKEHTDKRLWLLVVSSAPCTKEEINEAAKVLRRILHLEEVLTELDVRFDCYTPIPNQFHNQEKSK